MATDIAEDLRVIHARELQVGRRLTGHLRNARGRILVRAGRILTTELIDLLAGETLAVGPDWDQPARPAPAPRRAAPPSAPPSESAPAVENQEGGANRRAHARHNYRTRVEVVVKEVNSLTVSQRRLQVETLDISQGGFSFQFAQYVPVGAEVQVTLTDGRGQTRLSGVVRSCIHVKGRMHRIGVEFVSKA